MKPICIVILALLITGCQEEKALNANEIINRAIDVACSGHCESAEINFAFRELSYRSVRENGKYLLERKFTDSMGTVRDVVDNNGFQRLRNDAVVTVIDTMAQKYAESVNSVHYFAQLPYGLNAPAANKTLLGSAMINGQPYYEIGVTFEEEGGGTDFGDTFVYWVHKKSFHVDFLAYQYAVSGGGIRFREAYNPRRISGIRFVDYKNYKPNTLDVLLTDLDELFMQGQLELLSTIETENVKVQVL